jgi:uncharacterized protein
VFPRRSQPMGGLIEMVGPSFFNKSQGDNWPGVVWRYQHNDMMMLGATRSGTLKLKVGATGLGDAV